MPNPPDPSDASRLNANPDPRHASYKVLGLLSWGVLILSMITFVTAPRFLLELARLLAIYMMLRFIASTAFYLAGLAQIRRAEKRLRLDPTHALSEAGLALYRSVHHLVVLPNFEEPPEVLSRTLQALSVQAGAQASITVVLGMEERQANARDTAEQLLAQFEGSFHGLMAAYHPAGLPGELPGKATNETWAVRQARRQLVEHQGISPDRIVVTVADADSIIHPLYFAELTRQFAADPRRLTLVWQAPMLFDNEIWRTHAPIRLMTFFTNAISAGDMFDPLEAKFPYSTYSISLALLEEVDYWDPTALADDQDLFLRAFFTKGGRAFVQRIDLPVHGNPVYGASLWQALAIYYSQIVRHCLGGAEIGTLLQKWHTPAGAPFLYKLGRLLKLVHDHLFFSTAGFVVALGTLLSLIIDHSAVITLPPGNFSPLLFVLLNALGGSALLVAWLTERIRLGRGWSDWDIKTLAGEVAAWLVFPLLFLLLMNLPGLHAQTHLLFGRPVTFNRTPKRLNSTLGE